MRASLSAVGILSLLTSLGAAAQTAAPQGQVAPPSGQKTLAATMSVYVFPSAGQKPEQQSKDEAECYAWAVQNTGADPFQLQKQAQQQQQQAAAAKQQAASAGTGAGAQGAVTGAAAGALIGAIAGDAGEGAAYGAAAGIIAGRSRGRAAKQQATQQVAQQDQEAQQSIQQQGENFKKAFSVCLEAKKYMVKY